MILKIGTRASMLAMAQSRWVKRTIETAHPGVQVELIKIRTKGDRILDSPLSKIGGKGLFVKEIEDALLNREIDLAVHSMKDVPAELPEGLVLSAFPEREDPRDALVSQGDKELDRFPVGSRVGTSSLRRASQLLHMRPDLKILPLRGNVDTRLKKLESEKLQAVVLAAAGLKRLGLEDRISQKLDPEKILPAIGQGALGLEARRDNDAANRIINALNHPSTEIAVRAERALLKKLEGGCQVPIAGYAVLDGDRIRLTGLVAELDGSGIIKDTLEGPKDAAEAIGVALAEKLLDSGADKILKKIYSTQGQL